MSMNLQHRLRIVDMISTVNVTFLLRNSINNHGNSIFMVHADSLQQPGNLCTFINCCTVSNSEQVAPEVALSRIKVSCIWGF